MSQQATNTARPSPNLLGPPPRPVPIGLTPYLLLLVLASQLGWIFINFGLLLFWHNCAFGADVKTLLFLGTPGTTTGTITSFEATPVLVGTGSSSSWGGRAVFAVHYTYAVPGGGLRQGTSYADGNLEDVPLIETPEVVADLAVGLRVPVQYVRAWPALSRVTGMRTNVYPIYGLGVLVFVVVGLILLRPALKNYRRVQFLLAAGVESAGHKSLDDPAGHLLNLPLEAPAAGWLGIRDGQLHSPGLFSWLKVLFIPLGGLLVNGCYVGSNWPSISYTWHALLTGG